MVSQSAIRTPVIQDARPLALAEPSSQSSLSLEDVQSMEEQSAGDLVTEPVNSDAPDIASQVNSFFAQHHVSSSSSTMEGSPYLAQDFASVVDSLARASARANSEHVHTTGVTQQATPPSSSQSQQSPSPSDTLAPLLISSLQLPSSTVASTPPSNLQAAVLHDHPHSSATATIATPSPQGVSSSVPSNMLTPTTSTAAAGSLSIAASNTTPLPAEGASSQETPESNAIDPTFLAALPLSIRQEVLAQHRREQRVRQPPSEQEEVEAPFQSGISPEFLSALPPTIQSEVSECGAV